MTTADRPLWQDRFPPIGYWVKVAALVLLLVIAIRMLAILQGLLIVLAASPVLAIGLQPTISWLEKRGLPRGLAMTVIIAIGIVATGAALFLIVPVVVDQVGTLVETLPEYVQGLEEDSPFIADLTARIDPMAQVGSSVGQLPDGAMSAVGGVFSAIFDLLLVLTLTPYFAMSLPRIKRWGVRLLVREDREGFLRLLNRSTDLMANYIAGNLLVSAIAGVVAWIALTAIGVPYAAALAVFIALTDMVPAVGATVGAAAAVGVALTQGVGQALLTGAVLLTYQQVENYVIVPRVMRDAIDVSPAIGIVALLIGGTLAGPVGALLALPVAAMVRVLLEEFVLKERMRTVRQADAEEERNGGRRRPRGIRERVLP